MEVSRKSFIQTLFLYWFHFEKSTNTLVLWLSVSWSSLYLHVLNISLLCFQILRQFRKLNWKDTEVGLIKETILYFVECDSTHCTISLSSSTFEFSFSF